MLLYLPSLLFSQNIDTNSIDSIIKKANEKVVKSELMNIGNRLYYVYGQDTILKYLAINRKVIIKDSSLYYLSWIKGEQILIENNGYKKVLTSPLIAYYDDYTNIPKSWDMNESFWALNGIGIQRGGGSPFCMGADGYIESIPEQDLDIWTKDSKKQIPKAGSYDVVESLPMDKIFYERYFLKQLDNKKKGLNWLSYIDVRDSLLKPTYFDLLVTSNKKVFYILYHDKELMLWYLSDDKKQWEKYGNTKFSTNGYFTCFEHKKEMYLIDYESNIYKINKDSLEKIMQLPEKLIDISLVINKDEDSIGYVKQADIQNTKSIKKVVEETVVSIFPKK